MRMVMSSMTLQKAWIQTWREKVKGQQGESLSALHRRILDTRPNIAHLGSYYQRQDLLLAKWKFPSLCFTGIVTKG